MSTRTLANQQSSNACELMASYFMQTLFVVHTMQTAVLQNAVGTLSVRHIAVNPAPVQCTL
jgi:hypothetical protein